MSFNSNVVDRTFSQAHRHTHKTDSSILITTVLKCDSFFATSTLPNSTRFRKRTTRILYSSTQTGAALAQKHEARCRGWYCIQSVLYSCSLRLSIDDKCLVMSPGVLRAHRDPLLARWWMARFVGLRCIIYVCTLSLWRLQWQHNDSDARYFAVWIHH